MGSVPEEFKKIERRGEKAQGDANTPGYALPAGDPVGLRCGGVGHEADSGYSKALAARSTSPGWMVRRPDSGAWRRVWSRRLSGLRRTMKREPKGPLRLGSVGS